ncbi:hypothetical protein ACJBQ4_10845, partial [Streptococcus suis]
TMSRLRGRVRSILCDVPVLFVALPVDEREKLFADLDAYREFRERYREVLADAPSVSLDQDTPTRRVMTAVPEPEFLETEGKELYNGIIA